jgi:hypothetical protein
MKSIKRARPSVEIGFPKLMIEERCGLIILFSSPGKGTVVNAGNTSIHIIGDFVDMWCMEYFIDFDGTVILENDEMLRCGSD